MSIQQNLKKLTMMSLMVVLFFGAIGCTTTRAEPSPQATSYDVVEPLDTFGELEEDTEAYPWLHKEKEPTGPLGDAMSQSPYARATKSKVAPHKLKKASKRVAKRKG